MSAQTFRQRIYALVEVPPDETGKAKFDAFDVFIAMLIVLSVAANILASVPSIEARFGQTLSVFELAAAYIFAVEYLLRLWSCIENPRFAHPVKGRLRFIFSPMAIIDLLAFAPSLVPFWSVDLMVLRACRLLRIIRVLKLGRYSRAMTTLGNVLHSRRAELAVMGFVMLVVLIIASSPMYYIEHERQPETFGSIPDAMWWAVITLTTIGYGDVYPKTGLGKVIGGVVALCGIGIVALPTAIIAQGFAEALKPKHQRQCPHCGKETHE
jgi:voltage-gated potassium channel